MSKKTNAPAGAVRPFGWQDKLGYAMGDMGCGFTFQLISTYMQLYYVQCIGINEHYWWIILVSKLFDAINDVVIGNLVDTKRLGKKSKYMPWIISGGLIMTVFTVMVFAPIQNFSETGKILWCLLSYCLWSIAYTMVNVPYGSLHSVITDKPSERTALSTFRSIGAALPAVIIMMILPDIVYEDFINPETGKAIPDPTTGKNFQVLVGDSLLPVALIFSVVAFVVLWGTTKLVKERVVREQEESSMGAKAIFSSLKTFSTNRAMVGATIASIAAVALFNSTMSLNNMVFQYFFKDVSKVKLALVVSYVPLVALMPFIGKLTAKFGKKKLLVVTMLVSAIGGLVGAFIPLTADNKGMILYIAILLLLNVGNSVFQISVWAIVADCIIVSHRKTGKSEEGSLYAIYSFFRKLAQGIGQAAVSIGLAAIKFNDETTKQITKADGSVIEIPIVAEQVETFGDDLVKLYILLLMAGSLIAFLSMAFIYNIGKKEEEEMAALAESMVKVGAGNDD